MSCDVVDTFVINCSIFLTVYYLPYWTCVVWTEVKYMISCTIFLFNSCSSSQNVSFQNLC